MPPVIGYGGMGSWHGEYLRHSDVVNLMGVYDIKPERCEAAEKTGSTRTRLSRRC